MSSGSHLFLLYLLQPLQQTRTLVSRSHAVILVGHCPATRSLCEWGVKSLGTTLPNALEISLLKGRFTVSILGINLALNIGNRTVNVPLRAGANHFGKSSYIILGNGNSWECHRPTKGVANRTLET